MEAWDAIYTDVDIKRLDSKRNGRTDFEYESLDGSVDEDYLQRIHFATHSSRKVRRKREKKSRGTNKTDTRGCNNVCDGVNGIQLGHTNRTRDLSDQGSPRKRGSKVNQNEQNDQQIRTEMQNNLCSRGKSKARDEHSLDDKESHVRGGVCSDSRHVLTETANCIRDFPDQLEITDTSVRARAPRKQCSEIDETRSRGDNSNEKTPRRTKSPRNTKHHRNLLFKKNREFTHDCLVTREWEDQRLGDRWSHLVSKRPDYWNSNGQFQKEYRHFKNIKSALEKKLMNKSIDHNNNLLNKTEPNSSRVEQHKKINNEEDDRVFLTESQSNTAKTKFPDKKEDSETTSEATDKESSSEENVIIDDNGKAAECKPDSPQHTAVADEITAQREAFKKRMRKETSKRKRGRSAGKGQTTQCIINNWKGTGFRSATKSHYRIPDGSTLSKKERRLQKLLSEFYTDKKYFEDLLTSEDFDNHSVSPGHLHDEAKNGLDFLHKCADFWKYWKDTVEIEQDRPRHTKTADAANGRKNTPRNGYSLYERPMTT